MTPGAEVGNLVRVIRGVSRGLPPRKITANTAITITWDLPMVINPGDVWIIEDLRAHREDRTETRQQFAGNILGGLLIETLIKLVLLGVRPELLVRVFQALADR